MPSKCIFVCTRESNKTHFLFNISSSFYILKNPIGPFKTMIHLAGEETNGQKGKMISAMSHDLLVPLTSFPTFPLPHSASVILASFLCLEYSRHPPPSEWFLHLPFFLPGWLFSQDGHFSLLQLLRICTFSVGPPCHQSYLKRNLFPYPQHFFLLYCFIFSP